MTEYQTGKKTSDFVLISFGEHNTYFKINNQELEG